MSGNSSGAGGVGAGGGGGSDVAMFLQLVMGMAPVGSGPPPSSVTVLHTSLLDSTKVWSGNDKGVVTEWSTQRRTDHWVKDESVTHCCNKPRCHARFGLLERRHHCRNCGLIFCKGCSSYQSPVPKYGFYGLEKVCEHCMVQLHR